LMVDEPGRAPAEEPPEQAAGYPALGEDPRTLSWRSSLFLLNQIFQSCRSLEILEPLAKPLLFRRLPARLGVRLRSLPAPVPPQPSVWEPAFSSGGSTYSDDPASQPSRGDLDWDEDLEPAEASLRTQLLKRLSVPQDSCVLLAAGLLRSCLQVSNLLPQGLLVQGGLLPPGPSDPGSQGPPLEVLLVASKSLQKHAEMRIVAVQALCRLCFDVAFTPQARSLSGSREWREEPLANIAAALRSA
ncbi:unnamed protein product, partial [Symbiodinium microadriaticum]